ncbi:MAG: RHS repeat-associated core domain-containing protein, partial [Gemmatimonadaceae bacterium]|nr:RHS repeat-associated core domain-containing protein [Gemmatimonadaceae bacterium]
YEPETGWLSTVRDPLGNTTTFAYNNLGDLQTVNRPGSVMQRFTYSLDGEVQGDTIQRLGATARALSYLRDDIGRVTRAANGAGFSDTTSSIFSPFGHLLATTLKGAGFNYQGALAISRLSENYTLDALGNLVDGVTGTARYTGPGFNLEMSSRAWNYDSTDGSGRLLRSFGDETMSYVYDTDGNTVFVGGSGKTDRADFYNAANQLVASDARAGSGTFSTRTRAFSEFRYDALGRRVWVRTRRMCDNSDAVYGCRTGIVRRTIWDGVQELAEIQQPGNNDESDSVLENDGTAAPRGGFGMTNLPPDDPNPVFGAAVYVHAGALDAPLAILRLHYRQVRPGLEPTAANTFRFRPFMIYPQWRSHGEADRVTLPTGLESHSEAGVAVTTLAQPGGWTPYMQTKYVRGGWYGTLLENKRDQRGLVYRRNRYVDPSAGRFTQEDPIGLSGGLNTYGYAAGDPVTFSDPFGLSPDTVQVGCRAVDGLESFSHCAVRITNDSAGTSTVYELLATGAFARQTAGVQSDPAQLARYNGRWVAVDVPSGQSDNQFAAKARAAADQRSRAVAGRRYSPLGGSNSNRFVYDIVTRAGGQIPSSAGRPGRTAPGLCGGRGIFQGVDCRF